MNLKVIKILAKAGITADNFTELTIDGKRFARLAALLDKNGFDPHLFVSLYSEQEFYDDDNSEWTPDFDIDSVTWEDFINHIDGTQMIPGELAGVHDAPPAPMKLQENMLKTLIKEALGDTTRSISSNFDIALRAISNLQHLVSSELPKGTRKSKMLSYLAKTEDLLITSSTFMPDVQADVGGDLAIDIASGRKNAEQADKERKLYDLAAESASIKPSSNKK